MDLKKIKGQAGRLAALAEVWERDGRIEPIEQDIALELLREIYGDLRLAKTESHGQVAPGEEPPVSCAIPEPEPQPEIAAMPEVASEPEAEQLIAAETEPKAVAETEIAAETEAVAEPEQDVVAGQDIVPQPEPEVIQEPEPAVQERPVMPRRVAADVIRSLYGSDVPRKREEPVYEDEPVYEEPEEEPAQEGEALLAETPAEEPVTAEEPAAEEISETEKEQGEQETETETQARPSFEPSPDAPKTTLGDVMGGNRQTLGETLGNGKRDMASKIAAADTSSLRASIGLNDKFLMIRDMFEGDPVAYDEAISALDGFADLDDAIIYIHDTYNWSADSEGVKLLVELLERKLG